MSRVLLAGCGAIGMALGEVLLREGFEVVGLRRSPVAGAFPILNADFTQPLDPALFDQPIHYVVHTATPAERSDAGYEKAYPNSVRQLLAALKGHPLKRYFFVSSTAVYAQDDGSWLDETSPTEPTAFNGLRMLEAEQALLSSEVPATCVRFGGIYSGNSRFLLRKVEQGCTVQASPPKFTNRIHQDDCVGMLQFLLQQAEQGAALDSIYLGVDDEPASEESVCTWLARQLAAPAPVRETASAGTAQNKRCSNRRILDLGYRFRYPDFRSGYGSILRQPD